MKTNLNLSKSFCLVLLFCLSVLSLSAQGNLITGSVTDEQGTPLVGVTVIEKGTNNGTTTDLKGVFKLNVTGSKPLLTFSYIGYKGEETEVAGKKVVNMKLTPAVEELDEVVVVGYGVQRKRDVTGAITTINEATIEKKQAVSIYDALQGTAAGVVVIGNSAPGDTGSSIRIRGTSTLESGVDPLYIVDGVPVESISDINPNDVKSMEILRDAASAAIYGSRSANGVIIITTKSGEAGKAKVDVRFLQSFSNIAHKLPQATADDRRAFENRANASLEPALTGTDTLAYNRRANYDYQDLLTQTALRSQVDLSVKGGSRGVSYMASAGYLNERGVIINSANERMTARVNVDFRASDKFTFSTRFSGYYQDTDFISESTAIKGAMQRPAYFVLYYPDGTFMFNNGGRANPEAETLYRRNNQVNYMFSLFQGVTYRINKYLRWNANASGTYRVGRNNVFRSAELATTDPQYGTMSDYTRLGRETLLETYLTFDRSLASGHTFGLVAGASAQNWYTERMNYAGRSLVSEAIWTTNTIQLIDETATRTYATSNSLAGFFARGSYSYKGKYMLNGTIRYDGSSRFTNNQWGFFPSVSAGWRFSEEPFMKWAKPFLGDSKLRLSYGQTGNQAIGDYESVRTYVFGSNYYGGQSGVNTNNVLGNPDIKWETTEQANAGLDLSMLKGRISLTADYYDKKTNDLLYTTNMPSELGYGQQKVNFGSIQNRGFELELKGYPVKTKAVEWQTSVSYSYNKNKVLSLASGDYVVDGIWKVAVGQPLGQFYGYNNIGVYAYDESNAYTSDMTERLIPQFARDNHDNVILSGDGKPTLLGYKYADGRDYTDDLGTIRKMKVADQVLKGGDMIWEDLDHNGEIDDLDRKVLGNGYPDWVLGWTNSISYKNFNLTFTFYGSFGNDVYNEAKYELTTYSAANTTPWPYAIYNAWRFPGQITDYPQAQKSGVNNTSRVLTGSFLEDGAFIRLRDLRLSYSLDNKQLQKLKLSGLTLYVYGSNLFTWTNYSGYDPEFFSGILTPGRDTARYPRKREMGFGFSLNF